LLNPLIPNHPIYNNLFFILRVKSYAAVFGFYGNLLVVGSSDVIIDHTF